MKSMLGKLPNIVLLCASLALVPAAAAQESDLSLPMPSGQQTEELFSEVPAGPEDYVGERSVVSEMVAPGEWTDDTSADDCGSTVTYGPEMVGPGSGHDWLQELRLHHSSTDGRTYGGGKPMRGTSWMNRPFYVGVSAGGFFMTQGVQENVRNDNDFIGNLFVGWDWDYYWGMQWRFGRAGPELLNKAQPYATRDDALFITDMSLLYYPAGDTVVRPYLRAGVGWTDLEYPNDSGVLIEASPFTMPLGIGIKFPMKRWLGAHIEFTDHLTFADSAVNFHQNLTLVFGVEYRFGAKPSSYWPWNPSTHLK